MNYGKNQSQSKEKTQMSGEKMPTATQSAMDPMGRVENTPGKLTTSIL